MDPSNRLGPKQLPNMKVEVGERSEDAMMKIETSYHLRLSEFRRFSELVFNRSGTRFDMKRYDEIRLFIADRMRIFRMTVYEQYLQYLEDDEKNREVEIAIERLSRERVAVNA